MHRKSGTRPGPLSQGPGTHLPCWAPPPHERPRPAGDECSQVGPPYPRLRLSAEFPQLLSNRYGVQLLYLQLR